METGESLKNKGILKTLNTANKIDPYWKEQAYKFLIEYCKNHRSFMIEDVRISFEKNNITPASKRIWGALAVRAHKEGKIEHLEYNTVKNPLAHKTPATVWKVI